MSGHNVYTEEDIEASLKYWTVGLCHYIVVFMRARVCVFIILYDKY